MGITPDQELLRDFLFESIENLSNISEELTRYEKNRDQNLLNSIYRKVHTLKGSAGLLGYAELQEIAHFTENILDLIRNDKLKINSEINDVLLKSFDTCFEFVRQIERGEKIEASVAKDLKNRLVSMFESKVLEKRHGLIDSGTIIQDDRKTKTVEVKNIEVFKGMVMEHEEPKEEQAALTSLPAEKGESAASKSITESVIRVNVQLLDKIMNIVGELVLNRNQILQYANTSDDHVLIRLAQQLNVITTELQTDIMTTRMQPVGSVVTKFERLVRDIARSQNKRVKVVIEGKDTELDKTLLEAVRDPLTHLVRNSVDHGIEMPEDRKKVGKSEEGVVFIKAYHEGGQVTVEISDDGKGLNPDKISAKAVEKGLLTVDQVKLMKEHEIINLIFLPGFSTADKVTNISGRGVGMDVVKSNIEKIGGSVDITSRVGHGSTFKLKIPLTLAIIPALVIKSKGEIFAIPQVNVMELVRLEGEERVTKIEKLYESEFFRLRGSLIPIFRLNDNLNLEKVSESSKNLERAYQNAHLNTEKKKTVSASGSGSGTSETMIDEVNIVILNADGKVFGLLVDQIIDTEEIVVKPLSKMLKAETHYAGATIMGNGRVALIIDALGYYNMVEETKGHKVEAHTKASKNEELEIIEKQVNRDIQEILLCRLGDGRVYGIPLVLVHRLEEFHPSKIEWTGDRPIIRYGDHAMPLLDIEKSINLHGDSKLTLAEKSKKFEEDDVISCVVTSIKGHRAGLIVKEIMDIATSDSQIDPESVDRQGLIGTMFIADKTISIVDIHTLMEMNHIILPPSDFSSKSDANVLKILLAEDSPLYQKVVRDYINQAGYAVVVANDGEEALRMLDKSNEFAMLVSDIEMPNLNGFELCEKLRANERFKKFPIIALTTRVSPKDLVKGKEVGFDYHLEKFNGPEVMATIQKCLKGKRP